ncbi:MAG TPA: tetratricopeptide repeat protein [Pyrinomonadaceae bacterium]|nr:tetratricopeptide repeat protein [Pyrinomonadaceae bacterium]
MGRLMTALKLALYPAFEPPAEKRFQARYELAQLYQQQRRYSEAEKIFRDQLEEALNSPQTTTQLHAAHMSLARLYHDEGKLAEAEEHYKAAVAETEKVESWPGRQFLCSTSILLAEFYIEQHRYSEAEPLFQRALEFFEKDRSPNSYLPHHLGEFAKLYEAQEKYDAAEELYRRALTIYEEPRDGSHPDGWLLARSLDNLATFYKTRGRFLEAEDLCRRSLRIVEESVASDTAKFPKGKDLEMRMNRAQIPIGTALDKLCEVYECQEKYADAEPLRRRSLEIKERAWSENHAWIWIDCLAAYANVLHKIGREQEAAKVDEHVEAIRAKHPPGSVHPSLRFMSMPIKRNLRWRFATFVNAILRPTPRFEGSYELRADDRNADAPD